MCVCVCLSGDNHVMFLHVAGGCQMASQSTNGPVHTFQDEATKRIIWILCSRGRGRCGLIWYGCGLILLLNCRRWTNWRWSSLMTSSLTFIKRCVIIYQWICYILLSLIAWGHSTTAGWFINWELLSYLVSIVVKIFFLSFVCII